MPPITPTDIPVEASETADFVPASLAELNDAPRFVLRSPTKRDERFHRRLMREAGMMTHSEEAIREEVFVALEHLWTAEQYAEHAPRIREYFVALEEFRLQVKDDPDLEWSWSSKADEEAIERTVSEAIREWPRLRRMTADNADAAEMRAPIIAAIVVEDWSGLDTKKLRDRGYLSLDCAEELIEALEEYERTNCPKEKHGTAAAELYVACMRRLYLDEETSGNSESPSPSTTPPPSSKCAKASGASKASARSAKTPATA